MKIVCDSCSTKYSISDDKVRGKVFKIRCKKCSHIIVVRGTGEGAPAVAEAPSDAVWHLVVDGDQVGPLSESEVRARLSRGEITIENYVWKEGFSDWLRLVDVPEFADLGTSAAPVGHDLFSDGGASASLRISEAVPVVDQDAGYGVAALGNAPEAAAPVSARATSGRVRVTGDVGGAVAAAAAAAASEEDAFSVPSMAPRSSEGGDLFGVAPVAARADSGRVRARGSNGSNSGRHDGGRVENLTAQRSENSVLFSLSNLQSLASPSAAARPTTPQSSEGSGLIDIRAMAASTLRIPSSSGAGALSFGGESARSAVDDLPAFGAFSSAAPVLFPIPSSSGPPKWIYALIGVAVLLVIAVGVAAFSILRKPLIVEQAAAPPPSPAAPAAPPTQAAGSRALAEKDLPPREAGGKEGAGSAEKGGEKAGGEKAASRPGVHHVAKGPAGRKVGGGDTKAGGDSGSSGSVASSAPAETEKKPAPGSLDALLEGALGNKKPGRGARPSNDDSGGSRRSADNSGGGDSSAGGSGPLAKSAVVAGMNGIKGKISACYTQFKVPGLAMVNVVISKSGKVTSAAVTGKFAGTPTGSCVEGAVKSASFPPSEGLSTPYPFNLR